MTDFALFYVVSEKDFGKIKEFIEDIPHTIQTYSWGVVEIFLPISEKEKFEDTCTVKEVVKRTPAHKISISPEQKEKWMEELYKRKLEKDFEDLIKEIEDLIQKIKDGKEDKDYTTLEKALKDKEKKLFEKFRLIIKEKDITDNFSERKENELKERINAELKELEERCRWRVRKPKIPDV